MSLYRNSDKTLMGKSLKRCRWQEARVQEEKRSVKKAVDALEGRKRLAFILQGINELSGASDSRRQLRAYVYIMSALVHHEREGGLTSPQIRRLERMALGLLQLNGVAAQSSRLSFCHAELHLVLSQIRRREGNHWLALWEQQLASYLGGASIESTRGHYSLGLGIRALRQGEASFAISALLSAEKEASHESIVKRARFERLVALRLSGDKEGMNRLHQEILKTPGLTAEEKTEAAWQKACLEVQQGGSLRMLLNLVQARKSHYEARYVLEAAVWRLACQSTQLPTTAKVTNLPRIHGVSLKNDLFFHCASKLSACYDTDVALAFRLRDLGMALREVPKLVRVQDELLIWAGAGRWLARVHLFALASLCLSRYANLSVQLSQGQTNDCLGLMGDLLAKSWYLHIEAPQLEAA